MPVHCEPMGESALLLRLGEGMDAAANARVHALVAAIREAALSGIDDVVPAYASVLVRHRLTAAQAVAELRRRLQTLARDLPRDALASQGQVHDIPVCYGGECGEDLDALARSCGLPPERVIALHAAPEYRVAMTGFAPGFPYLMGLDPRLATPRRRTPRTRVPAGSVGIAGAQTGIYPGELPGGWQLIGRIPLRLFDPARPDRPCLLLPGDRVRFRPVGHADFLRHGEAQAGSC